MSKDQKTELERKAAQLTDQATIALFCEDQRALRHFVKRANRIARRARKQRK